MRRNCDTMTAAQEIRHASHTVRNMAFRMGVSGRTMERWLRQADVDDGGPVTRDAVIPPDHAVQAARMLLVIARTCPAMLSHLQVGFHAALDEVVGEPLRLRSQPTMEALKGAVREGE